MSREPGLTYEGALRILGRPDRKWLERLSALLGGAVLAGGASSLAIAPAAVLGWIEPKNEAIDLLRKALTALPGRLRGTQGLERREQVIAAHTAIAVAAFFEALRDEMGRKEYRQLALTDAEIRVLVPKATHRLYATEIRAPSVEHGFAENLPYLHGWYVALAEVTTAFIEGLAENRQVPTTIAERAVGRYIALFLKLAALVPEFRIWIELTEHSATRGMLTALNEQSNEVSDLLATQTESLARLERLLTAPAAHQDTVTDADQRECVAAGNRAALDDLIIPEAAAQQYGRHLIFPKVRQIFVTPHYRLSVAGENSSPRWRDLPVENDLDLRLVAHITSADASTKPLLVLGHPGAGKSMLTRVLAARLPEAGFTVVRVPLRHVGAHSPVHDQIQEALDRGTHRRVQWPELVNQSLDTVRVVILDGLDELLHESQSGLYGYLRRVQEFQRNELAFGRPAVVLVTSRTTVADRVDIPAGTPVIKLEEFDDDQIARWLEGWDETNAAGRAAGTVRALELKTALDQRTLTSQPLLLMMMAIYVADPGVPVIDERISTADLYERLLRHFAEREAAKSPELLTARQVDNSVEHQLRHLSIAALGMFNRGRQDIGTTELGSDLASLEKLTGNTAEAGHRVLGKFFFIHVAEARYENPEEPDRCYEFLHATFGEYLVARLVVDELAEIARAVFSSRRGAREPDDDLLFAMLSFQALSTRLPILDFAETLCSKLDDEQRANIAEVLTALLAAHRDRHGSDKYQDYRPKSADRVRELAAYSANLILLRHVVDPRFDVPLADLFPGVPEPEQLWRSVLALWQAGLDDEAWNSLVGVLRFEQGFLRLNENSAPMPARINAYFAARLAGDRHLAGVLRYGFALTDNWLFSARHDDWAKANRPWLAAALANRHADINTLVTEPPEDAGRDQLVEFYAALGMLLKTRASHLSTTQAEEIVTLLFRSPWPDPVALAAAVRAHPVLLDLVPGLSSPAHFASPDAELLLRAFAEFGAREADRTVNRMITRKLHTLGEVPEDVLDAVRELILAHRWPRIPLSVDFPESFDD